jgi:hypothetical protein
VKALRRVARGEQLDIGKKRWIKMSVPYFIQEEIDPFDDVLAVAIARKQPIFLARCHGLLRNPECIEVFVAAYLLMNVLLMERLNRKILKLVFLEDEPDALLYAVLNALRSLLHSDYSSLEEIGSWKALVERRVALSAPSLQRIESAINFIHGSGIQNDEFRRANVYLGTKEAPTIKSPYTVTDLDTFRIQIASERHCIEIFTPEIFIGGKNTVVRMELDPFFVGVEVDVGHEGWLDAWLRNVELIVASKMYAGLRS